MLTSVTTIERFILDQEDRYPEATGELSNLLYDIALAAKIIAAAIRRAGLVNILGTQGDRNVQGEEQQKLDVLANETIKNCLKHTGRVCVMGSEEDEDIIPVPPEYPVGKYAVLFDPLDGSSNIDVNSAVGTIFSIHRRLQPGGPRHRGGRAPAGLPAGGGGLRHVRLEHHAGVHHGSGRARLHAGPDDRRVPAVARADHHAAGRAQYYSVNESNFGRWDRAVQAAVRGLKGDMPDGIKPKNSRYIGSLVADFHRNLISGGVFLYPADTKNTSGKLRLLYEASPMAFIAEQAEGSATDGVNRILDIVPDRPAPAHAAGDREPGGRRLRGRHDPTRVTRAVPARCRAARGRRSRRAL